MKGKSSLTILLIAIIVVSTLLIVSCKNKSEKEKESLSENILNEKTNQNKILELLNYIKI